MVRSLARSMELGDVGLPSGAEQDWNMSTTSEDWRLIYALLELHKATGSEFHVKLACRVADNIVKKQSKSGLFPRSGRAFARTSDEAPLAVLHLAAVLDGKQSVLPRPVYDSRFFHCEYHGELEQHQKKRADRRTYDHLVFYGSR